MRPNWSSTALAPEVAVEEAAEEEPVAEPLLPLEPEAAPAVLAPVLAPELAVDAPEATDVVVRRVAAVPVAPTAEVPLPALYGAETLGLAAAADPEAPTAPATDEADATAEL